MKTELPWTQISKTIGWADIINQLWFFDETEDYTIWQVIFWKLNRYTALVNTVGLLEWDFSNAPDVSTDREVINSVMYSVHPSLSQSFSNAAVHMNLDLEETSSSIFSLVWWEIIASKDITVFVSLSVLVQFDWAAWNRSTSRSVLQRDTGAWFIDVPYTEVYGYVRTVWDDRATGTIIQQLTVNAWDKLRVEMVNFSDANDLETVINGCGVNLWTPSSGKWEKGDKWDQWDAWSPWDITWEWVFTTWVTIANTNEAYEFLWSSYVCLTNWTTTDPSDISTDWDVLAERWIDWSWSTLTIQGNWSNIPNTPHSTLNFTWDVELVDEWAGVAKIDVIKNSYMLPIYAEENQALGNNAYEWGFGANAATPNDGGVTIYVPLWYTAKIIAMSIRVWGWTATVESLVNGVLQWVLCNVTVSTGQSATNDSFAPVAINIWDYVNFRTTSSSGTSWPNVVTMWIEYTKS